MSPVSWPWLAPSPFTVSPGPAPPSFTILLSPAPPSLYFSSLPKFPLSIVLAIVSLTSVSANFIVIVVVLARWLSVTFPLLVPNTSQSLMSCWVSSTVPSPMSMSQSNLC